MPITVMRISRRFWSGRSWSIEMLPFKQEGISFGNAIILMVLLVSLLGLTYMIASRGWPQTKSD